MTKLTKLLIFAILILVGLIVVVTYRGQRTATPPVSDVTYTDVAAILPSPSGEKIETPNFLKDAAVKEDPDNEGVYLLGNTFSTTVIPNTTKPPFVITYDAQAGYFNIVLLEKPLASSRIYAEVYLRDLLKLGELSMCKLSYTLSVPGYVDEEASGIDYRFSFCPDGIQL